MAKRRKQPIKSCLLVIGCSFVVLAMQMSSDLNSPVLFLFKALIQPISMMILVGNLIIYALTRSHLVLAATLFSTLIIVPFLLPKTGSEIINKSNNPNSKTSGTALITGTFSTLTRTKNIDDIVAFAKSSQANLLCLQEVSQAHRKLIIEKLKQQYPYQLETQNNQLTLSTYPLTLTDEDGHIQASVLTHPKWGELVVINAHMSRPYQHKHLDKAWVSLLALLDKQTKTVLCGDLNITPNNTLYDLLQQRYKLNDALSSGYGFTFPSSERRLAIVGPFIRIDYIFTKGLRASNTQTLDASDKSDHKAVLTHIHPENRKRHK